ncbi:uncharacterized protein LOC127881225 [Dreissena polymorpha]|uniref:TIR domain-containing protein n=1 Tax=Dreissena polymorpha TaxID=45954 RepID=A0A9D4H1C1_DREPO|nr:uncharacterized protein LOC127881225 [Dreissena polymorpha]KAH3826780.1 hypothetical protein DPMN_128692 [Dreissena polymorpha]
MDHSINKTIKYRDREHAGEDPSLDSAYATLSLGSLSDAEYDDYSVLHSDSKVFLKDIGHVNELMHNKEAGRNVHYSGEELNEQSMYTTTPSMNLRIEANDYSSYGPIAFCVPKLERSANQTQVYPSKMPIVNFSRTFLSPIVCTVRPFKIPEEPLSCTVEPDCDPIVQKSSCCIVEGLHHSTSRKTQSNDYVEKDALFCTANGLHSTNKCEKAGWSALKGEVLHESLTTQMSRIRIESSIKKRPINVHTTVETAVHDAHIRAEQSEIMARENVFQTMVSCEPVSVDIGRNEEQMQTYATDYLYISKKDIVIIHSEDDIVRAAHFKESIEKLCDNKLIPGVTVDLQQHIDAGKQAIGSLDTLHDRYRCILVFVTDAFQSDAYKKFHSECVLVFGLDSGGDKLNRVVPVWVDATRRTCKIPYLKTLNGIAYTGKTSNFFEELMLKTVKHFRELIK